MSTRAIRLLQIVDSLNQGGMENIMIRVCNHLAARKFEVTVCCLGEAGMLAGRLDPQVRLRTLKKEPGFRLKVAQQMKHLLKTDADVVHTHHLGGLIYTSLGGALIARPAMVHSEHILWDSDELAWKRQMQRRLLYRLCTCLFTVSTQQMDQMLALGHKHRWQFVLPNGVDLQQFRPSETPKKLLRQDLGLDSEGVWLAKVARFGKPKRHVDLIAAFEQASQRDPRLRLLLVGDGGSEKQRVLSRMEASPVRDKMHWAGFQQDPTKHYQAMDALVMSSSFEGLPNAVLEGMACGLPVLANDACGVSELARDGEHGWIGDFSTVEKLAEALNAAAATPQEKLRQMGRSATEHVRQNFSIEKMLEKYENLYTTAAAGGHLAL